jgi:hypothetical protein
MEKQGLGAEQPRSYGEGNSPNPQSRNWHSTQRRSISKQTGPRTLARTIAKMYQWIKPSIKDGLKHCE